MSNKLTKTISFEQKIQVGIFPSKEEFENVYNKELTREEICKYFNFSVSTFKKLRRYYNLPLKKKVVRDKESYKIRVKHSLETLKQKYGEKDSKEMQEFYYKRKQKLEKTCLEKYGTTNVSALPEIMNKRKQAFFERYGVDNPMKLKSVQEKAKQTDLQKYGTEYHITSDLVKDKIKRTMIEKYGVDNSFKNPQTRKKIYESNVEKYGNPFAFNIQKQIPISKQQRHINDILKGQLNKPFGYYFADIYIEDQNVVVEYSGGGHNLSVIFGDCTQEEFHQKEIIRRKYFQSQNISMLEFVSSTDKLPSDEFIMDFFNNSITLFKTQGKKYIRFNFDKNIIEQIY